MNVLKRARRGRRTTRLGLAIAAGMALLGATAPAALAESAPVGRLLYTLETNCTVRGVPQRCAVEAWDGRTATMYRTTVNGTRTSFRLFETPGQRGAQIWSSDRGTWTGLDKLSLDFDRRILCLNGDGLCLENPNFFASLRQQYPELRSNLIMARFDAATGLLTAICYTREACNAGF